VYLGLKRDELPIVNKKSIRTSPSLIYKVMTYHILFNGGLGLPELP
jgi:hypothetical protein